MITRRNFIKYILAAGAGTYLVGRIDAGSALAQPAEALRTVRLSAPLLQIPGGTLDPLSISKYELPLIIPPAMPTAKKPKNKGPRNYEYYEIAVRQFEQRILPDPLPVTTVWSYGSAADPATFNYPAFTIEARWSKPTRVKWINGLVDDNGKFLPHLLPVDPTLHWANPPGGTPGRDTRPDFTGKTYVPTSTPEEAAELDPDTQYTRYWGPVPIVTHVHGAVGVGDESDGYTEAWYLPNLNPDAQDIDLSGFADSGTWYDFFKGKFETLGGEEWAPGTATFQYPNDNRASTIWYHDHSLGMTRLNVYAGPAGFFLIRGGPSDVVMDTGGNPAVLPGPAPKVGSNPFGTFYEIPIAIQDRSFNEDGSLFYPDTREFFDEIVEPYIPDGPTPQQFSPIWQPEFFGNTMVVNGRTWPYLDVEQRRYRLRFLNGCQSRFLILDFDAIPGVQVWAIGNEGGFLAEPVNLTTDNANRLLMGLAERADLIVDFTNVPVGNYVLGNVGPDEPFGGGVPEVDFDPADPGTTGQVMEFRVGPIVGADLSTPPASLVLPAITPLPSETVTRRLALLEEGGLGLDAGGVPVEGPVEALLGTVAGDPNEEPGVWTKRLWMDPVTETPEVGATEVWEIYNATGDAHPMHVHEVVFEVVNRQDITVDEENQQVMVAPDSEPMPPEAWENGLKDTVIAYPGQVTRIRLQFNTPGQFVWHCHIVEHEDNEMMRPFRIGPEQPGQPGSA